MEEEKKEELQPSAEENVEEVKAVEEEKAEEAAEEPVVEEEKAEEAQEVEEKTEEVAPEAPVEAAQEEAGEPALTTAVEEDNHKIDDVSGDYAGQAKTYDNAYFNPIRYVYDKNNTIESEMARSNQAFQKKLSGARIVDILSIVMMGIAFVGVILVSMFNKVDTTNPDAPNTSWITWLVLGIALVIIVASFILTTVFNKKNSKLAQEYLNEYQDMLNGYVLSDLHVDAPTLCVDAEIDDQEIIQAHYYKTINKINSRGLVEAKRNDHPFVLAEVAVVIPTTPIRVCNKRPENLVNFDGSAYVKDVTVTTTTGTQEVDVKDMTIVDMKLDNTEVNQKEAQRRKTDEKKTMANRSEDTQTGLFGKYYSYGMSVTSDESFILCFPGEARYTILPNYLTGFKPVFVPGLKKSVIVYAVKPLEVKKFFDEEGLQILNEIKVNNTVQSMFISVNSYGSKIGMNLSDEIMQLSFKKVRRGNCYELYKEATDRAFQFLDYVDSKKAQ